MNFRFILGVIILVSACSTDKKEEKKLPEEPMRLSPGCYRMIIGKDTALLDLRIRDTFVTGKLVYNRFEKDDNTGMIEGVITGGKIDAWYRYQSEGVESLRQVVLRIGNNELFEGYGEFIGSEDSAAFRFPQALRYEENHPYQKIECNEAGF